MPSPPSTSSVPTLRATYTKTSAPSDQNPTVSPSQQQHTFTHRILPTHTNSPNTTNPNAHNTSSVQSKTAYLGSLRAQTKILQDEVNAFLTAKMEEDKSRSMNSGETGDGQKEVEVRGQRAPVKDRDEELEEKYGEEDVDGDDDG